LSAESSDQAGPDGLDGPKDESRRKLFRNLGIGGAAALAAGATGHQLGHGHEGGAPAGNEYAPVAHADHGSYGHGAAAPLDISEDALAGRTIPPPPNSGPQEIEIVVTNERLEVGGDLFVDAWTFNGSVPGPIIRATKGDELTIRFKNRTDIPHNLHFHGRHAVTQDGWEPIPAGGDETYAIVAGPAGVHPYHCHTPPLAVHMSKGLFGTLIVDPLEARSPAHEVVLVLHGWDVDGVGRNSVYAWNGVAGFFSRFPIKVPVGERVRAYILNMTEYDPIGSFHLHAETFDVYRAGTGTTPTMHTDTVSLGQGERAVVEFTLPELGRYMFHPHQIHMAENGAMGWFAAV
jgi:FtsP/CotA-like multicopper oxidase with cupredoxin domain